jgi:hypothetical protein
LIDIKAIDIVDKELIKIYGPEPPFRKIFLKVKELPRNAKIGIDVLARSPGK